MPHQDRILATEPAAHCQDLKIALDRFTADADFAVNGMEWHPNFKRVRRVVRDGRRRVSHALQNQLRNSRVDDESIKVAHP